MAHLDLHVSTEALADCSVCIQERSPTLLVACPAELGLYLENIAKGENLSFMGKKIDPFGMSEWVSSCNNPTLSP